MERYNKERLVEIVLYVLNKTGELDYYTLLKTIYFAELKHLAKWGQRITADDVCAMPYGPVLSHLLDAIKGDSHEPELSRMLKSAFKFASEDASNIMRFPCDKPMKTTSPSQRKKPWMPPYWRMPPSVLSNSRISRTTRFG